MKWCPRCKLHKQQSEFSKDKTRLDGLRGVCKECTSLSSKVRYKANPDKFRHKAKLYRKLNPDKSHGWDRWRARNPDKVAKALRDWKQRNKQRNKEKERAGYLRRTYGLDLCEYRAMLDSQGGVCAICGLEQHAGNSEYLFVDHDHETGKVRELLCHHCNAGLGHFKEDTRLFYKAVEYLNKHKNNGIP